MNNQPRGRALAATVLSAVLAMTGLGSCSSDSGSSAPAKTVTSAPGQTTTTEAYRHTCERPVATAPTVTKVADTPSDLDLVSFDDTQIRLHWFPTKAAGRAPTVLIGPGWSLPGDTSTEKSVLFGSLGIGQLNEEGYNVLTWDPRGFGKSGGVATVDSPDHEGRDMQRILDWLATQPQVQLDSPGDPRVGMAGFSYGGGIQLTLASIDCRADALVPGIAWHSLGTSLYKSDTIKLGWAGILMKTGATGKLDPHITRASNDGQEHGRITNEDREWFLSRGPGDNIAKVSVPTLFVQGTVDTLFTLDEAIANYSSLKQRGIPTAMVWFCGGHGTCLTAPGRSDIVEKASLAWLDRYLKDDESAALPARFTFVDQDDTEWSAAAYPQTGDSSLAASGTGNLKLVATGGSGPIKDAPGVLGFLVGDVTPAPADNAVNLTITADSTAMVLGAPTLSIIYSGSAATGDAPTRVFAQLVDEKTSTVIGNQITPIPVTLDGAQHSLDIPLEVIAHRVVPGQKVTLQLVASTVAYGIPRLGGAVNFSSIDITLPLVTSGLTQVSTAPKPTEAQP